jgi:hypothetical protein
VFESNWNTAPPRIQPSLKKQPTSFQIADDVAQRAVNDYVTEKLKSKLKKLKSSIASETSRKVICSVYEEFMKDFDLEQFCKLFKCLNSVKALHIDRQYIIDSVYFYLKKNRFSQQNHELECFSELQLKVQLEKSSKEQLMSIEKEKSSLGSRLVKIRDYIAKHTLKEGQMLTVSK